MLERVQGYCPSCGGESLFLGKGGHVTCNRVGGCKDPTVADRILDDRETDHIVCFSAESFTIRHPLRERAQGDDLFTCELHRWISRLEGPPAAPGRYRATPDGGSWRFVRLADEPLEEAIADAE